MTLLFLYSDLNDFVDNHFTKSLQATLLQARFDRAQSVCYQFRWKYLPDALDKLKAAVKNLQLPGETSVSSEAAECRDIGKLGQCIIYSQGICCCLYCGPYVSFYATVYGAHDPARAAFWHGAAFKELFTCYTLTWKYSFLYWQLTLAVCE